MFSLVKANSLLIDKTILARVPALTHLLSQSCRFFSSTTTRTFDVDKDEPKTSEDFMALEYRWGAKNYKPIPVVIEKGRGAHVWDVEGKEYLDFLAAYSAVNQGHCHPKIVKALQEQVEKVTLTSRAFYNSNLGKTERFLCRRFGYDRALLMNSGVEGGESALKFARRWGYRVKGVPSNSARVLYARGNFWGRSVAACSSSSDPSCFEDFGPYTPGLDLVPYDDLPALEAALRDPTVVAFYVEPIQGEAGVVVPGRDFLRGAAELCRRAGALLIADEIQTGLGRAGFPGPSCPSLPPRAGGEAPSGLLASDLWGVRPDVVVLGKALSGGLLPVSAVLASHEVMLQVGPGEHGSTYGGNPLACAVTEAAIGVIDEEQLPLRSHRLGLRFRSLLQPLADQFGWVREVRGRGLMNAIEIDPSHSVSAWELCLRLKDVGLLAKPTHDNIIRFTPPLVISDADLDRGCEMIDHVFKKYGNV